MPDNRVDRRSDFYTCGGHQHRKHDGLMVNPYTYEVLPDQWCTRKEGEPIVEKPTGPWYCNECHSTIEYTHSLWCSRSSLNNIPVRRKVIMSQALWCDRGNHAFSSLDEDMEEGTRKIRRRNALGERVIEEVEFHACGLHSQFQIVDDKEQPAIQGTTDKTSADDFRNGR